MSGSFSVHFKNRQGISVPNPVGIEIKPVYWNAQRHGGWYRAELSAVSTVPALITLLDWLDYKCYIHSDLGPIVWMGYINAVRISIGGVDVGLTLDGMANRVAALYTYTASDGATEDGETDYYEFENSIQEYGKFEYRKSIGEGSLDWAQQHAQTVLDELKYPLKTLETTSGDAGTAVLECIGPAFTMDREYWLNYKGKIEKSSSGSEAVFLRWGVDSTTDLGIENRGSAGKLCSVDYIFTGLVDGIKVKLSGRGDSIDGTYTIDGNPEPETIDDKYVITANTIRFDPQDDIKTSTPEIFVDIDKNDCLRVTGSASNSYYHMVEKIKDEAGELESAGGITSEAEGPTVTLTQAQVVKLDEVPPDRDMKAAGETMSIRTGTDIVAQSFSMPSDYSGTGSWLVGAVAFKPRKFGSPAGTITIKIHEDSGGNVGTVLDTITLSGSSTAISSEAYNWVEVAANLTASINDSDTYWISIELSGSYSAEDFLAIEISTSEENGYEDGVLKTYDGSSWSTYTDGSMPFRILGKEAITSQMTEIAESAPKLSGVDNRVVSTIQTNQFSDGENRRWDVFSRLIQTGTDASVPLKVWVDSDDIMHIDESSPPSGLSDTYYFVENDGRITNEGGSYIERGKLIAGEWIGIRSIPPGNNLVSNLSPFLCELCEYDATSGETTIEPVGTPTRETAGTFLPG